MGKLVFLDSRLYAGAADLSGVSNKIEIGEEAEDKKTTNFRSGGAEECLAGLTTLDISAEGEWEAGNAGLVDDAMWNMRRTLDPWTVMPEGSSDLSIGAANQICYFSSAVKMKSQLLGQNGEVAPWMAEAKGTWPLVRGVPMHPSGVVRTATGTGSIVQVGAVPAGSRMYANLHVLSIAGTATPSIAVKVQSASLVGFGSPTDRMTFATRTVVGGESLRVAGPITDAFWRVSYTITGTTPGFLFLATLGIER